MSTYKWRCRILIEKMVTHKLDNNSSSERVASLLSLESEAVMSALNKSFRSIPLSLSLRLLVIILFISNSNLLNQQFVALNAERGRFKSHWIRVGV